MTFIHTAFEAALRCLLRRKEPFWRDVTIPPPGRVIEISEIGWVVQREESWFERGEVRNVDPVPRRNEDVLGLDVTMRDLAFARVTEGSEYLKRNPLLFNKGKKGASTIYEYQCSDFSKVLLEHT